MLWGARYVIAILFPLAELFAALLLEALFFVLGILLLLYELVFVRGGEEIDRIVYLGYECGNEKKYNGGNNTLRLIRQECRG